MDVESIPKEERKSITQDMILIVDKITEVNLQNKKFLDKTGTKVFWGILSVMAVVGTGIGNHSTLGGSEEILQLIDTDDDQNHQSKHKL